MEVVLLFILSGAVGWALGALLVLAFLHALGRATANGVGLPHGSKSGVDVRPSGLPSWPSVAEVRELASGSELLQPGRER